MTYARAIDANQPEIVKALRKAGCTVEHLYAVGKGCPDLLVSIDDQVFLIEVKDGTKPPSAQALTPAQITWHKEWCATVHVVNSIAGALEVVAEYRARAARLKNYKSEI